MWVYWTLFLWPALTAVIAERASVLTSKFALWFLAIFLMLIIGLRFEVGPDWGNYLDHLDTIPASTWRDAVLNVEPAYWLLNWTANAMGYSVWLVNLVCAVIYVTGLLFLCRQTTNPWLAFTVAMPFMAIVVGMNYTRQSAALGLVSFGIVALLQDKLQRFIVLAVAGTLFHRSAIVILPLGALVVTSNRIWRLAWIMAAIGLTYYFLVEATSEILIENYITEEMVSGGTVVRVLMNFSAAVCIIVVRQNPIFTPSVQRFWTLYALSTIPFLIAIIFLPPLTAIDRLALYWMPLQVFGFANLPNLMKKWKLRTLTTIVVICAYFAVQFVWFNYGNFSSYWKPYRFYPLEAFSQGR